MAPTGGFWGVRSATSSYQGLHIQLNQKEATVTVLNKGFDDYDQSLEAEVNAYDITGNQVFHSIQTLPSGVKANTVVRLPEKLQFPAGTENTTLFWRLKLLDGVDASTLTQNIYWLSTFKPDVDQDYSELIKLKKFKTPLLIDHPSCSVKDSRITIPFENLDFGHVAFGIHVDLHHEKPSDSKDTRVLPAFMSDNYFMLLPGGRKTITIDFAVVPGTTYYYVFSGWNISPSSFAIVCQ